MQSKNSLRLSRWNPKKGVNIKIARFHSRDLTDWLDFFDHRAFCDNQSFQSCYCTFFHKPKMVFAGEASAKTNREYAIQLIKNSIMKGYVVRDDKGRIIGWSNINQESYYQKRIVKVRHKKTLNIMCFVVQKDYRGQGITTKIIEKAIADSIKNGYKLIEAYPKRKAKSDAGKYHGRYDVFKKLGFIEERIEGKCVMRKYL